MIKSYLHNHINEGFDVLGRKILLNPRHNLMLDTRLSGEPVKYTIYSNALQKDIEVYSVFKRVELLDSEKKQIGLRTRSNGDSNPVIYSLKKENGWGFLKKEDEEQFWKIFEHILRKWLREHKNQYDTVVMVPSSSHINKNIIEMIQKLSEEVGIGSFITKGLIKMTTSEVEDMASDYDSYFYKYWSARNKFDEAFEKSDDYCISFQKGKVDYMILYVGQTDGCLLSIRKDFAQSAQPRVQAFASEESWREHELGE